MAIRITSDSTCDLGHLIAERDITLLPLAVNLGEKTYYDGVDITPQDIFDFVAANNVLPKTAAPSIGDYEDFFKPFVDAGDEVIHFNISAKSSGSYNMALQAAESFGGKVHVIDSMALSSGQGLLVLKAADMRDNGNTADEIEEAVNAIRERVNTSFIPDRLDYLYKGGRCSKMEMFGANILKIHPLIYMDGGKLVPGKKYRGKMSFIIKQYIDDLKELYPNYEKTRCFITHSSAEPELVEVAKQKVKETFEFDEVIETVAGSIITSHCGKGTLGVLFIYEK
ncbi:MAG: DegV family protein [Clostridia bacterium]|nr:DegV family protein [Clostridia bacterium]